MPTNTTSFAESLRNIQDYALKSIAAIKQMQQSRSRAAKVFSYFFCEDKPVNIRFLEDVVNISTRKVVNISTRKEAIELLKKYKNNRTELLKLDGSGTALPVLERALVASNPQSQEPIPSS